MKYVCEVCKKQFDTPDEAAECELNHQKKREQDVEKESTEKTFNQLFNAFISKYKAMPKIDLTEENRKILMGDLERQIDEAMDSILSMLD